jgi:hypothetical protein
MTIAACYLSSEGIVLGADSTTSRAIETGGYHYFNHNQKIFEVGENATVGIVTWGLAGLGAKSYRTLIATFADDLEKAKPTGGMTEVAKRWSDFFWGEYQAELKTFIQRCKDLSAKPAYSATASSPTGRTEAEEKEFNSLKSQLVAGFCIAGYWSDRTTMAFEILVDPLAAAPTPRQLAPLSSWFWGTPNLMKRLIFGVDDAVKTDIMASTKWTGTAAELDKVLEKQILGHGILPVRDAIDFVHTCIYSTIKALKFSSLFQICGGPIELAVITSDRKFRWVRHKSWDSAVLET